MKTEENADFSGHLDGFPKLDVVGSVPIARFPFFAMLKSHLAAPARPELWICDFEVLSIAGFLRFPKRRHAGCSFLGRRDERLKPA